MRNVMVILAVVAVVAGCATNGAPQLPKMTGEATPWTSAGFKNAPDVFRFAIVSDRTGGHREGVFPQAIEKLNLMQPEFVLCVGDLIEGYTENLPTLQKQYDEVDAELAKLEMTFFRVPGNHDITNDTMTGVYHERYGRSWYHFRYKDVLFLCLNSEDPPGNHLSEEQLAYFDRALAQHRDARWTLVFLHKPFWLDGYDGTGSAKDSNWLRFESMLQDRPYTVFAGHTHAYAKYERLGRNYYILSTTGGGSNLAGPDAGEFDHIVWVTMDANGPRVANVLLDGILPDDVVTELSAISNMPTAPESFTFEPLWVGAKGFLADTSTVSVENPSDRPVDVALRFDGHPRMLISASERTFTVPAGGTKTFDLRLQALAPIPADELEPVVGEATLSATDATGRVRQNTGPLLFAVQPRRPIPTVKGITVDGDLADWPALPYTVDVPAQIQMDTSAWRGPQDASFRFGVARDDAYLYVAIDVQDDEFLLKEGGFPWEQDAVELRLSARPEPERSQSRGKGEFQDILLLAITPGQTEQDVFARERLPEGFRAVSRRTATGHTTEVAIPHAYLDAHQGQKWEAIRLNIALDDSDTDGLAQIWWQPDWRTRQTATGSGTFQR